MDFDLFEVERGKRQGDPDGREGPLDLLAL
jgi:hypothetical protein